MPPPERPIRPRRSAERPLYVACLHNSLAAIRSAVLEHQITTSEDIDRSLASLEQTLTDEFQDFTGIFIAELIAQVPEET